MFRVTLDNVAQKRTIRPLYAKTQATPYACYLDPEWDRSADILPGMVMTKLAGEVVTLAKTDVDVFGLSALFVAPQLGIDEVRATGTNNFAVWVGDNQSVFEVLAPAFDTTATWDNDDSEGKKPLYFTLAAHAEGPGKLTPTAGEGVSTKVAAHLIQVVGSNKIIVSLEQ